MRVAPLLAVVAALALSGCATMRPEPVSPTLAVVPPEPAPPAVVELEEKEPELLCACRHPCLRVAAPAGPRCHDSFQDNLFLGVVIRR
jgi:hypothetical protein